MFKYTRDKIRSMKRGDLAWDFMGKIILALVVLFIVAFVAWLMRDKFAEIIENFPKLFLGLGG